MKKVDFRSILSAKAVSKAAKIDLKATFFMLEKKNPQRYFANFSFPDLNAAHGGACKNTTTHVVMLIIC